MIDHSEIINKIRKTEGFKTESEVAELFHFALQGLIDEEEYEKTGNIYYQLFDRYKALSESQTQNATQKK